MLLVICVSCIVGVCCLLFKPVLLLVCVFVWRFMLLRVCCVHVVLCFGLLFVCVMCSCVVCCVCCCSDVVGACSVLWRCFFLLGLGVGFVCMSVFLFTVCPRVAVFVDVGGLYVCCVMCCVFCFVRPLCAYVFVWCMCFRWYAVLLCAVGVSCDVVFCLCCVYVVVCCCVFYVLCSCVCYLFCCGVVL